LQRCCRVRVDIGDDPWRVVTNLQGEHCFSTVNQEERRTLSGTVWQNPQAP
jgi:hypothetical protein